MSARRLTLLGTDAFGLCGTRAQLREHFGIDEVAIVLVVLIRLVQTGQLPAHVHEQAQQRRGR